MEMVPSWEASRISVGVAAGTTTLETPRPSQVALVATVVVVVVVVVVVNVLAVSTAVVVGVAVVVAVVAVVSVNAAVSSVFSPATSLGG